MRRFVLERHRDVSGVSGTGRVVEGVCWLHVHHSFDGREARERARG